MALYDSKLNEIKLLLGEEMHEVLDEAYSQALSQYPRCEDHIAQYRAERDLWDSFVGEGEFPGIDPESSGEDHHRSGGNRDFDDEYPPELFLPGPDRSTISLGETDGMSTGGLECHTAFNGTEDAEMDSDLEAAIAMSLMTTSPDTSSDGSNIPEIREEDLLFDLDNQGIPILTNEFLRRYGAIPPGTSDLDEETLQALSAHFLLGNDSMSHYIPISNSSEAGESNRQGDHHEEHDELPELEDEYGQSSGNEDDSGEEEILFDDPLAILEQHQMFGIFEGHNIQDPEFTRQQQVLLDNFNNSSIETESAEQKKKRKHDSGTETDESMADKSKRDDSKGNIKSGKGVSCKKSRYTRRPTPEEFPMCENCRTDNHALGECPKTCRNCGSSWHSVQNCDR